jgi:hypothetical protein
VRAVLVEQRKRLMELLARMVQHLPQTPHSVAMSWLFAVSQEVAVALALPVHGGTDSSSGCLVTGYSPVVVAVPVPRLAVLA